MKNLLTLIALVVTMSATAQPDWPTITSDNTNIPADLLELSKDYCFNQSFTPADTVIEMVPRIRRQHRFINFKWTLVSVDTSFVPRPKITREVRRLSLTHGSPMLNQLLSIVNAAPGQLEYLGRTGNTWSWHKKGLRFTDPEGKLQDIPPYTVTLTLLPDNRFELRHSNTKMVRWAAKFDPEQVLTSFLPYIAVEDGVAYNRTLINGRPWDQVNIRNLMTPWGKRNQSFVFRWWTYGDTGLTTAAHKYVDGYATSITQYEVTDPRAKTLNIQPGPIGRFDQTSHTFTYPPDNGKPIYFMLQAEFKPAQHKQWEARSYYLLYPYGYTPQGAGFLWPVKDFDPNRQLY